LGQSASLQLCPCGSCRPLSKCCGPYLRLLGISLSSVRPDTLLIDWLDKYSMPSIQLYREKVNKYVIRISWYLDWIVDEYLYRGFKDTCSKEEQPEKTIFSVKNNVLLSLFAALSCLSQGLFLQSGTILRCAIEDCLVIVDLFENEHQIEKLLQGKYSTNGLLSRVKKFVPADVIDWYGYFSANFTHFGPLHPAPYLPAACHPDNWVLITGLENLVRAVVTFHIALERVYFDESRLHMFWRYGKDKHALIFNEDSRVFAWAEKLGKEIVKSYPPDERKEWFQYDTQSYRTK
jgi:hypothetical protein